MRCLRSPRSLRSLRSSSSARVVGLAIVLLPVLIAAACGGDDDDSASSANDNTTTSMSDSPSTTSGSSMTDGPFGAACAQVPTTGEGSVTGMADDPVATAASNNPLLAQLVAAVGQAKLVDTLNTAQDITVFAPTDDAFAGVPKATLDAAMADPSGLLTKVLTYHVVQGRLAPDQLAGEHTTLEGEKLMVTGSGEDFMVNDSAKVVCGNVPTANATVYVIDGVLLPPSAG